MSTSCSARRCRPWLFSTTIPSRCIGAPFTSTARRRRYADQSVWAGIATLNGLPATTMPISHSESGLPIGVQIVGNYLEDRTTIAFAGFVEREFGGFIRPSKV